MGKSDRTEERAAIRTAEKGKYKGKITPLSAGKQTAAKTVSKEEIYGQRTMRKVEQKMKKTIFEEMGGTYVRCGDYFIPNLTLPEEEEPRFVGVWGQRHLQYLKEYRRIGAQAPVIIKALETNEQSLADIMKTIRELGIAGQLTPELTQYLFAAYNQALMQSSYLLLGR